MLPRFDMDSVRRLAGDKVFARGESYFREGLVEILDQGATRVLARVSGSETYRTLLTGKGRQIGGECSCPAFEDFGFCKHMVGVAFAANQDEPREEGSALDRIRHHLLTKSAADLTSMILDLAERDEALFRRLDLEASVTLEDDKKVSSRLRKAITSATRTGGFVAYREAADWAAGVRAALDAVGSLLPDRAAIARTLAEHALSRIEAAIEELDDSDGYATGLLERARDIHLDACRAEPPDPVELARDLFEREVDGDWDTFHGASELYAEILGEAGLAEYRRLAIAAWGKIPPQHAERRGDSHAYPDQNILAAILDSFAEREGDVDARIALRSHDLSSPWRYLELAKFCLEQGREAEALRHADEGLWLFEDKPDERLVTFVADLHRAAGRNEAASAALWPAFERQPSLALYERIRLLGGASARDRAIASLRARLSKEGPQSRWSSPADLLIQILMAETMFDEAWAVLRTHEAGNQIALSLARTCESSHPKESLAIYAARIERLVIQGGNHNYQEARSLLDRMARLREASEHAAYTDGLKTKFKAKRNFIKLLGSGDA